MDLLEKSPGGYLLWGEISFKDGGELVCARESDVGLW